ncbi:MAG: hypothetical protein NC548_55530 [Lachnospiraceae bacterium]|nr:hypothetical protein [Lachnospiraceae bacterium]
MSTKDFSSKQEKMIAAYLGWSVVSGSGSRPCHPGDIIGDDWLGECKTHTSSGNSIFFSSEVWKKICDEAMFQHRNPVLFTDDGSQKLDRTWCIINSFTVDDTWKVIPLNKKFRSNITMKHDDLKGLYSVDNIISGIADRSCYSVDLKGTKVVILPIILFNHMIQ